LQEVEADSVQQPNWPPFSYFCFTTKRLSSKDLHSGICGITAKPTVLAVMGTNFLALTWCKYFPVISKRSFARCHVKVADVVCVCTMHCILAIAGVSIVRSMPFLTNRFFTKGRTNGSVTMTTEKVVKHVCITTNQPDIKSNPNPNPNPHPNPNPSTKQHAIVNTQLNIVS